MSVRSRLARLADGIIVLVFIVVGIVCGCALEASDAVEDRLKQIKHVQRRG